MLSILSKSPFFRIYVRALTVILLILIIPCNCWTNIEDHGYVAPEQELDGWLISSPFEQGMNEDLISAMHERIVGGIYTNVHALLIVKNGFLVFEGYYNGYDRDDLHPMYSVTKSVSSALMGIAVEKGFIWSIDTPVAGYLPEYGYIDWSNGKEMISVADLLTMRSGLEWEELVYPYTDPRNSHYQMTRTSDWYEFVLQRPMADPPGTVFEYNTGTSNLMAGIIENCSGIAVDSFVAVNLFQPLGVTSWSWSRDPQGNPCAGGSNGGLNLRPLDMAKFGYLYLNRGFWENAPVVPAGWVALSIIEYVHFQGGGGYGYQWWSRTFAVGDREIESFYALGYGGQYIFCFDSLDLMVVYTSGNYERNYAYSQPLEIMSDFVLPASVN